MSVLAIDYGGSAIKSGFLKNKKIVKIKDDYGNACLANKIFVSENGDIYIGKYAVEKSVWKPKTFIDNLKENLSFNKDYSFYGKKYSAEDLVSITLKRLKDISERFAGKRFFNCIVSLPYMLGMESKALFFKSAISTGFDKVTFIDDTIAAYFHDYNSGNSGDKSTILVLDFGGAFLKAGVIVERDLGRPELVYEYIDSSVGGKNLDYEIRNYLIKKFFDKTKIDLRKEPFGYQKVLIEAEKVKILLSERKNIKIEVPFISANSRGAVHFEDSISRYELEQIIKGLVERALLNIRFKISRIGLNIREIDKVLVLGGISGIPFVFDRINEVFGKYSTVKRLDSNALLEGMLKYGEYHDLAGNIDIVKRDYGVEVYKGRFFPVIKRGERIPVSRFITVTTVKDYQSSMRIKLYEREYTDKGKGKLIKTIKLSGIKKLKKGMPSINIFFHYDYRGFKLLIFDEDNKRISQYDIISSDGDNIDSGNDSQKVVLEYR